jgi:hypothetical protein
VRSSWSFFFQLILFFNLALGEFTFTEERDRKAIILSQLTVFMQLAQKCLNIFEFAGYTVVGKQMAVLDIMRIKSLEFPRKKIC